jgi:anti-sigma regulatory factor (Ser/Thr protein kinase)
MKDSLVITIPSHPKFLSVTRAVTSRIGQLYEVAENTVEEIKLAVDEACANVIKHAYQGDTSKKIMLKFHVTRDAFTVIIEDSGLTVRTGQVRGRSLDDVRPGGLGVHFIKKVFDTVEFDKKKGKGNRLTLIRHMNIKI